MVISVSNRNIHLVFGGAFDPVHVGHKTVILELLEQFDRAHARILPSFLSPHKGALNASPVDRLNMLKASLQDVPQLLIDDRELARTGPSYTYDTLLELRKELGPDESISFVIGSDLSSRFDSWHRADSLAALCHFVVLTRPSFICDLSEFEQNHFISAPLEALCDNSNGYVSTYAPKQISVSSTQIRDRVQSNLSIKDWVDDAVVDYICDNALYR